MTTQLSDFCALCGLKIFSSPIYEDDKLFCCVGCHAVHMVLSAKEELELGIKHPLFQQALSAGLISHPTLLEELKKKESLKDVIEKEKISFSIQDMWCPSCSRLIAYILLKKRGVLTCFVDYSTDLAIVEYQPRYINKDEIFKSITSLGYSIETFDDMTAQKGSRASILRAVITTFFALNVMMLAYPLYATFFDPESGDVGLLLAWLSGVASLPVLTYGAYPIYMRFIATLRTGFMGMETLVVLGTSAAALLSFWRLIDGNPHVYFDTATVIIALVLVGKVAESRAKFNAKQTFFRLAKLQPKRGRRISPDGNATYVPIEEINPGDLIQTLTGEKIILDGVVFEGEASCDESLLTGEGLPVYKEKGCKLIGGSTLLQGSLIWKASVRLEEALQHRILQLVQRDLGLKVAEKGPLDTLLKIFIPLVIILSVLSGGWNFLMHQSFDLAYIQSLSVLLIACPCALGIAIPLVESKLIQKLAEMGVLVRNRACLSLLGNENLFIFDKTGTVTHGYFQIQSGLESLTIEQRIALKSIARHSTHPISQAIVKAIEEKEWGVMETLEYAGRGMTGKVGNNTYHFGSELFMKLLGIEVPKNKDQISNNSLCWVAENNKVITCLLLSDTIKEDVQETLKALEPLPSILLSGDAQSAVASVAKKCGFNEWRAEFSPLEKREFVLAQKQKKIKVAMVGDGINDAPALTAADVAISVVSATDISIQVSDLLLTTEKLSVLIPMRKLATKARIIIKQNLFWTFFYNVIGIGLALMGLLSPIYSAFAMVISSLFVILNTYRCK